MLRSARVSPRHLSEEKVARSDNPENEVVTSASSAARSLLSSLSAGLCYRRIRAARRIGGKSSLSEKTKPVAVLHSDLHVISISTRSAAIALTTLFFIGNIGAAVSAAHAHPVPPGFSFLYFIGVAWAIAWWVLAD